MPLRLMLDKDGNLVDVVPFVEVPQVRIGDIVLYVDETVTDYNHHEIKPALIQCIYETHAAGHVHLHVYEAYPQDNRAVDAYYSANKEPGTWHFREVA